MKENGAKFVSASAYSGDVLQLPVESADIAAEWYREHFSMDHVEYTDSPVRGVILERNGVKIGFSENGGDSSQNGAAILVEELAGIREDLEAHGVNVADARVDERDGKKFNVFFVVAPDGLCYYFHEQVSGD